MGITDHFKKVISREDVYLLKPDNEGFKYIYEGGTALDKYLFIGDSDADRIAAEKSGIKFLHIDNFDLKS